MIEWHLATGRGFSDSQRLNGSASRLSKEVGDRLRDFLPPTRTMTGMLAGAISPARNIEGLRAVFDARRIYVFRHLFLSGIEEAIIVATSVEDATETAN